MSISASHPPQSSILVVVDDPDICMALTELNPHLPIIILTTYTSFGKKFGILDIPGASASLAKPYKVQELTATVGRALCYSVPACGDNSQPFGKDLYG